MKYHKSILESIGNTPLIQLNRIASGQIATVLAKVEGMNPGHSAKDRIAKYIIEKSEREGSLKPGGTIIEATSGNTGYSMAMVAAVKGYSCILCVPNKISKEKIQLMEAIGAKVKVTPSLRYDDPQSHYSIAAQLEREIPNSIYINQYFNQANTDAHYHTTGPEIWDQTEGKITCLIAAMGTGGTLTGTAKYLKEKNPEIRIVGIDAYGSILQKYHQEKSYSDSDIHPYLIEAVGKNFIPGATEFEIIDEIIKVNDRDSALMARRMAKKEGILSGYSSGGVMVGLKKMRNQFTSDDIVVVLLADHGSRYLSKIYNNAWMQHVGFFHSSMRSIQKSRVVYLKEQLKKVIDFYS